MSTQVAEESPLAGVRLQVSSQVARQGEILSANITSVRLFSGMHPQVNIQMFVLAERFATDRTNDVVALLMTGHLRCIDA